MHRLCAESAISGWRRRNAKISVVLILICFVFSKPSGALAQNSGATEILDQVKIQLAEPNRLPLAVRRLSKTLSTYYLDPSAELIWWSSKKREGIKDRIQFAAIDGLQPNNYPLKSVKNVVENFTKLPVPDQAAAELYISAIFLKYASDVKVGRLLPGKIDSKLFWHPKEIDFLSALTGISKSPSVDAFFENWEPQIPAYKGLKLVLALHWDLLAKGGWNKISFENAALKPGMSDAKVRDLWLRLAATEDLSTPPNKSNTPGGQEQLPYDGAIVEAVKRFQKRHGLEPDGVIGRRTLLALNIPVEERIRQIIVSMERWRWMPEDLGEHYILVNIAGFDLRRVRSDKLEEHMRVVVGKPYHQTPIFSNKVKYLELNPYWNVPYSIATKEELPKLQNNPQSLAARGFEVVSGDRVVDVTSIDWSQYSRSNFPFRLRQRPGDRNALGQVKFMFPNRFNVYMHDTPSRSLFGRSQRAFSHGCIRLSRPIDFANQLTNDLPGWNQKKVDEVLKSKKRTVVNLSEPLPVHITYSTVWLGEKGIVHFRPDIYGRDRKLYAALFGRMTPDQ